MKQLVEYICESQLSDKVFCEQFSIMFKGTKLTKDILKIILSNLNKDFVLKLSKYFASEDNANYIAYEPAEDMFIKYDDNKDKIISQISEYLAKYNI